MSSWRVPPAREREDWRAAAVGLPVVAGGDDLDAVVGDQRSVRSPTRAPRRPARRCACRRGGGRRPRRDQCEASAATTARPASQRGRNEASAAARRASGRTIPRTRVTFSPIGEGMTNGAGRGERPEDEDAARIRPRSARRARAAHSAESTITATSSSSRKNGYSASSWIGEQQRSLEEARARRARPLRPLPGRPVSGGLQRRRPPRGRGRETRGRQPERENGQPRRRATAARAAAPSAHRARWRRPPRTDRCR